MRRMMTVVLAAIFAVALMSSAAFADSYVAENLSTETKYTSVQEALYAANSTETIRLIADSAEQVNLVSQTNRKVIFLDLNGYALTSNGTVLTVEKNWALFLEDNGDSTPHYFTYYTNSSWKVSASSEGAVAYDELDMKYAVSGTTVAEVDGGVICGGSGTSPNAVRIGSDGEVTLRSGMIFGSYGISGGAVSSDGTFNMEGGSIVLCTADMRGGAVCSTGGTFNMDGGTISRCTSYATTSKGGAVYAGADFCLSGGTISDCSAVQGGAVYVNGADFDMTGGLITDCTAGSQGGAVYLEQDYDECPCTFDMTGGTISKCTANHDGGGVYLYWCSGKPCTFTLDGGTIAECTAKDDGGGVFNRQGTVALKSGTISKCKAEKSHEEGINHGGGGVYLNHGTLAMTGGSISECSATDAGGGVSLFQNGGTTTFTMSGGTVSKCSASNGGGAYMDGGTATLSGGSLSECSASSGGGVYVEYGELLLSGGTVSKCTAKYDGGGVYAGRGDSAKTTISAGSISGCTAARGGGLFNNAGTTTMSGGTITGCSAAKQEGYSGSSPQGGGVYNYNNDGLNISGNAQVTGNTKTDADTEVVTPSNIFNVTRYFIYLTGNFTGSAGVSQNIYGYGEQFGAVKGEGSFTGAENFVCDLSPLHGCVEDGKLVWEKDPVCQIARAGGTVKYSSVYDAAQNVQNGETIVMIADSREERFVQFTTGTEAAPVTLDLNGFEIMGNGDREVILLSSSDLSKYFILKDSSQAGTGTITQTPSRRATDQSRGIVNSGYHFIMQGGTITGCIMPSGDGGGVYNYRGYFTMEGGTITGCSAERGGGLGIDAAPAYLHGGTITNNTATEQGGGVYVKHYCFVSGSPEITGNTVGETENNVYLPERLFFTLDGDFTGSIGAHQDAAVAGAKFAENIEGSGPFAGVERFFYDGANLAGGYDSAGDIVWKKNLENAEIAPVASQTFSGKAKTPKPAVTLDGTALVAGVDFTYSYRSNVNAGTAYVTATGIGDYAGSITGAFAIEPLNLQNAKITLATTTCTYDGKLKKPAVTVKNADGTKIPVSASTFAVTYSANKLVGKASVKIAGKGNCTGTVTKTFKINPAKTSIKTLAKGTKSFKVTWTKKTTQVTGYQIRYSTKKSMASAKTVTVKSYKTTSKTVKNLKAKKKYYVQVRTYKTVKGVKYYSAWSAKKYVTTR